MRDNDSRLHEGIRHSSRKLDFLLYGSALLTKTVSVPLLVHTSVESTNAPCFPVWVRHKGREDHTLDRQVDPATSNWGDRKGSGDSAVSSTSRQLPRPASQRIHAKSRGESFLSYRQPLKPRRRPGAPVFFLRASLRCRFQGRRPAHLASGRDGQVPRVHMSTMPQPGACLVGTSRKPRNMISSCAASRRLSPKEGRMSLAAARLNGSSGKPSSWRMRSVQPSSRTRS